MNAVHYLTGETVSLNAVGFIMVLLTAGFGYIEQERRHIDS